MGSSKNYSATLVFDIKGRCVITVRGEQQSSWNLVCEGDDISNFLYKLSLQHERRKKIPQNNRRR